MLIVIAAAASLLQPAAPAGPPAPPPIVRVPAPSSAEAITEAERLFEGDQLRDQMIAGGMIGMRDGMEMMTALSPNEALPAELVQRLQQAFLPEIERIVDREIGRFRREAAVLYARHFSVEELRELKRLMSNPVFQRLERLVPVLMLEMGELGKHVRTLSGAVRGNRSRCRPAVGGRAGAAPDTFLMGRFA